VAGASAVELYQAGDLDAAIQSLSDALRSDPTDAKRRTFLFELLCFNGAFDRAEKQLDILAKEGRDAEMGTLLYRGALHAERIRHEMFGPGGLPQSAKAARPVRGTLNGQPFQSLVDADPRIGARLEVYAAGQYTWLPLEHISTLTMGPPKRLRDLLWAPVVVRPSEKMSELELGELLMPVLTPGAAQHPDARVRLGRVTDVDELSDGTEVPVGQKLLLVDDTELPILELRELVITPGDESV
jgi:type VI secretion system protein ImpE